MSSPAWIYKRNSDEYCVLNTVLYVAPSVLNTVIYVAPAVLNTVLYVAPSVLNTVLDVDVHTEYSVIRRRPY